MIPPIILTLTRFGGAVTKGAGQALGAGARTIGRGASLTGRGAVGAAKTLFVANLASSMSDVDKSESDLKSVDIDGIETETPIKKPELVSSDVSEATLKFTEYVNQQTDEIQPVRALGQPLPVLSPTNEQSQVIQDIIENINGIKKRLESVEIKTRNQTSILLKLRSASMGLNETVKDSIEIDRQNELQLERDIDEERVERKGIGDKTQAVFGKLKDYAEDTGSLIKEYIKKFGLPMALISAPALIPRVQDFLENNLGLGFDEDMTLEELGTKIRDISGTAGLTAASLLGGFRGAGSQQARIVSSFTGKKKNIEFLRNIRAARSYFTSLKNSKNRIVQQVGRAALALPPGIKKLVNKALKVPISLFRGILIFEAMLLLLDLYFSDLLSEEEFDKKMKNKISELIRILGIPWLLAFIFGMVGTPALGIGGLIGAAAGFLAGILLGDFAFKLFSVDEMVDAFYDAFIRGDYSKLKTLPGRILDEMPNVIGDAIVDLADRSIQSVKSLGDDSIASQEIIDFRYGEGAAPASILLQASAQGRGSAFGIGYDDEDAILYAFKDVETPADYFSIKNNFETETLPEYNENIRAMGAPEYNTMEEYLSDVLSYSEYDQLKNQIRTQVSSNQSVPSSELDNLMNVVNRDTDLSFAEETNIIRSGKGVRIKYPDGSDQVLFENEIKSSERIDSTTKQRALNLLKENRELISDGFTPSATEAIRPIQETQTENRSNLIVVPQTMGTGTTNNRPTNNQPATHSSPYPSVSTTDPFIDLGYLT